MWALFAVIPSADPLPMPAPPWLLAGLLLLTFFLHLVPMNFVLGGSLIAAVSRLRGGEDSSRLVAWMTKVMPTMLATAITFGVAPLLFVQALYGRLFFSSAVLMAWFWFAVVPLVIIAYYGTYVLAFRKTMSPAAATALGVVLSLMFLTIAFIYSNKMSLMLRADAFLPMYLANRGGTSLNLGDPTLIPRYLHMLLGAIGVAGLVVAIYGLAVSDEAHGAWAMKQGTVWFLVPTVVNLLVGLWWFALLPRDVMFRFMGKNMAATLSFTASILCGLAALVLAILSLNAGNPRPFVKSSVGMIVLTLVLMIVVRDQVRLGTVALAGFRPAEWVEPQWGIIAIFAVLLVGALGTVAWMTALLFRRREA